MPAEGIHITAFREALASQALPSDARRACIRYEDAGRLGAVLPDLPYFDRYAEEVLRYATRRTPRPSPWGSALHDGAAIPIVYELCQEALRTAKLELAALALGAASHAAIDRMLHPLVNALARAHADGRTHDAAHREVEKLQSICFHQSYFGTDRMGTDGIVRLVRVPMRELFENPTLKQAVSRAFQAALPCPPSTAELIRMSNGYEQHARLIGSPVGRLVASEAEKEMARPRFLFGAWGDFATLLEEAVAHTIPILAAAWEACTSADEVAQRALRTALPPGSIDDLGEQVRLDRIYKLLSPSS